jgi:hypothetical protein
VDWQVRNLGMLQNVRLGRLCFSDEYLLQNSWNASQATIVEVPDPQAYSFETLQSFAATYFFLL